MLVLCRHNLNQLRDPEHAQGGRLSDPEVEKAAGKIVAGLSVSRLVELEARTTAMLQSGEPIDGEFWDLVLRKIHVEKAIVSAFCWPSLIPVQVELHPRGRAQESPGAVQEKTTRRRSQSPS